MSSHPSGGVAAEGESMQSVAGALSDLFQAGHYQQVIDQGLRFLEHSPEAFALHYFIGLAHLNLEQPREAGPHVKAALEAGSNEPIAHHLGAVHANKLNRRKQARQHIDRAIELDPDCAVYHGFAAVIALSALSLKTARHRIETALQLDPRDPEILRLAIQIRSLSETIASQAWGHIEELQAALSLEPNSPSLHAAIGDILLDELDRPAEAEEWFRQALLLDPSDRRNQKALFKAIGKQRLVYRVLSIPSRMFEWLYYAGIELRVQPWRLLWFLIAFKFVVAAAVWLVLATVLFWPAAKFYEWLLIDQIRCAADASHQALRLKRKISRWPFSARFSSFLLLLGGFWLLLFLALGVPLDRAFLFLGIFVAVHFTATLLSMLLKKARTAWGKRSNRKRSAASLPPPHLSSQS